METTSEVAIFEILRKNRFHSSCTIYIELCDKANGFDILYTESNGQSSKLIFKIPDYGPSNCFICT